MRFTLFTVVFLGLVLASLPPALARSQKHNSHRDIVEEDYDEGLHMPVRRVDPYIRRDNDPLAQIAAQVSHMASKYRHNFQAFADSHNGKKNPVMNVSIPTDAILEGVAGTTMELGLGSKHKAERRATSGTSSLAPVSAYSFWKGSLNIGTPAQEVEVLWDTGSADFVLNTNQYDDSKSSSAKDTNRWFSIGYADGTGVEGSIFNETVSVVGKEGRHQAIGVPATSTFPSSDPAVVGLAWQAVSVFKRRPFVQTLSAQGSIPRAMFGVALARDSSAAEIRIGGYNPKKLASGAKLNWNTINPSSGFWVTKADQVVLSRTNSQGTKTSKLTNRSLILDTGTSLIYAPTADVKVSSVNRCHGIPTCGGKQAGRVEGVLTCEMSRPSAFRKTSRLFTKHWIFASWILETLSLEFSEKTRPSRCRLEATLGR